MTKLIAIDFFCGAGGATCGFRQAGIEVLKGIDLDITAKETYEKNNSGSKFLVADITKVSANDVMLGINRKGKKLVFIGCAPCQPFSYLGKNRANDSRKPLIIHFGDLIKQILPDYIFAENVPGFAQHNNRYFKKFLKGLSELGYHYEWKILNAKDYGVPQNRKRFVLIASKSVLPKGRLIPEATHGLGKENFVSVRDAIFGYPRLKAGQKDARTPNHYARELSIKNISRLKCIPADGGSRKQLPPHLVLTCHKRHGGHSDAYGRMKWDTPSPTLTCKCTSISNGRFAHPKQHRGISAREAAALQTFADNYIFYGTPTYVSRHIGNAVPVLFARRIAENLIKYEDCDI
jgi:DNA (cytosine-5)-methyltransferase 1